MSWSQLGFCEDCQCDIWLSPTANGWIGTCPNCNVTKTYGGEGDEVPTEPEPVDMDLMIFKAGEQEPTWHFTNRARYLSWLAEPSRHWAVHETGRRVTVHGKTHNEGIAHRTPTLAVYDGTELRTFLNEPELWIWANRNYKAVEHQKYGLLDGKNVHFYKVIN